MSQLFGFIINKGKEDKGQSPIPPNQNDSLATVAGGYFGTYVDVDGSQGKNEYELIKRYRDMALHPECDSAVDEIVNEFVVSDADDSPVEIELSNLDVSAGVKKKIREEFNYVKRLLNFDKNAHQIIRHWYIDGRTYYHKVVDLEAPKKGILELRYIDPLKLRKVRQKIKSPESTSQLAKGTAMEFDWGDYVDYYIYNPKGFSNAISVNATYDYASSMGVKIACDSIAACTSGLTDLNKKQPLSFLHKAIKSLNQLRMIEDSLVIYRLSRAPERRIFYIDVGNLPKVKAEQYLRDVMTRYRNKLVYDANTGEIRDDKKYMAMLEDFWLPRREGGRGTEISTLPGGQNLGEITDIEYFKKKLYRSLNVPPSRMDGEGGFNLGRSSEILRDELKFTKFVARLRKRFSNMFNDMLKTQLILKNVITPEDWEIMSEHIQYDFLYDNHFAELKDAELMNERLTLAATAEPYVGKYYSQDYLRRKVLRQTDQEILEQDELIKKEIAAGVIPDPAEMMVDPATGQPAENGASMDLGKPVMEPEVDGSATEAPELPKGGEI